MADRQEITCVGVLAALEAAGDAAHPEKLARYGIAADRPYGVPVVVQRRIAAGFVKSLPLALELWASARHEARMIASMLAPPEAFTPELMDTWVADFASWDICDGCCGNLFRHTPWAWEKVFEYARHEEEFVRRAGFVLAAEMAVCDKRRADTDFLPVLNLIRSHSTDARNFVRKAVNWALRQTGKRSHALHKPALALARELAASSDRTARWIGSDAVRELTDPKIIARIKR